MSEVEQSGKKVFSARCLALYLTLNVYKIHWGRVVSCEIVLVVRRATISKIKQSKSPLMKDRYHG